MRTVITVGLKKMLSMSFWTVFCMRWKDGCCKIRVQEVGREWNLTGILDSEGEVEGIRISRKALFKFLNCTGLMRIMSTVKRT